MRLCFPQPRIAEFGELRRALLEKFRNEIGNLITNAALLFGRHRLMLLCERLHHAIDGLLHDVPRWCSSYREGKRDIADLVPRHQANFSCLRASPFFMERGDPMGHALKQTVLVVEDDQLQRELVSLIFEESDLNVIQCRSAEAAAAVLEQTGGDLMLMFTNADLHGEMSGIELAWIAMERFPHIDVIVTSEQAIEDVPDNTMFMQKPWLPLEILRQAEISRQRHTVH